MVDFGPESVLSPNPGVPDYIKTNLALIDQFLAPLPEAMKAKLANLLSPRLLSDPELPHKIAYAEEIIGEFETKATHVEQIDPENETIDLVRLREYWFYSLCGALRDARFYLDPSGTIRHAELQMMANIIEQVQHDDRSIYLHGWQEQVNRVFVHPPFTLLREDADGLKFRFGSALGDALIDLANDSVLDTLMDLPRFQKQVTDIVHEYDDHHKERLLAKFRRDLLGHASDGLEPHIIERFNAQPHLFVERMFNNTRFLAERVKESLVARPELRETIPERLLAQDEVVTALRQYFGVVNRSTRVDSAELSTEALELVGQLRRYLAPSVLKDLDRDTNSLAVSMLTELICDRIRNLNKVFRIISELKTVVEQSSIVSDLENLRQQVAEIRNIEARNRKYVGEQAGTPPIVRAEFTYYLRDIVRKINEIIQIDQGKVDLSRYAGLTVFTPTRIEDQLEALRVEGRCLSYDCPWGESHFTIPEMLFSGTSETIVVKDHSDQIQASLTVRLLPALIDGQLEPVLFRQKARAKDSSDMLRIVLNDTAIRIAAASGATRILAVSGFIGDPHAPGYDRSMFEEGFVISLKTTDGSVLQERITLSRRHRHRGCSIYFVAPEFYGNDGFHAHDNKFEYPKVDTVIAGIKARAFCDPHDRVESKRKNSQEFWVVDIKRERL